MSRFGNLEFESNPNRTEAARPAPMSDEVRCCTEARTAFEGGEFESALRWYARTLEFNPRSLEAWIGQCRALVELGQFKEAKIWADKALEKFPNDPGLLAAKAMSLGRLGELDVALAFSDAALDQPGDFPLVWLARGDVLLARKDRQVDHCFERALQLSPGDWFVRWMAARIRAYWKQFAAALKLVREAAEADAGHVAIWILTGRCQMALGLTNAAEASFQQALALQPDSREADNGLREARDTGPFTRFMSRFFGGAR